MRILLLSPFWSPVTGGISRFVSQLHEHLGAGGHDVEVIAMSGSPEEGVAIIRTTGPALWRQVYERIRSFRPNVIHVHSHWALLAPAIAAKLRDPKVRVVFTFHTATLTSGLRRRLFSMLLNRCDVVTAVSADTLSRMSHRFQLKVPVARTPPGADMPADGDRVLLRECLGIPADAPVVVAVSPLQDPRKVEGLADLIRSFPHVLTAHAQAHLVILGDGVLRPYLERLIQERSLLGRVHLVGTLPDVAPALRTAALVCHISYQEELPHVVLEAMAHERALLCSPVGGIPEAVRDEEEALFVEGGPPAIAEKVGTLLSNADLRRRLAARAFERFCSEYTWERAVTRIMTVYGLPCPKRVHLSIDVEEDYHDSESRYRGVTEALPRILDLFRKHGVLASAFVTADVARRFPEVLERLRADGHEVGSHGLSHADPSFASLSERDQRDALARSAEALESRGIIPVGFRAPNFQIDASTLHAMASVPWSVDSSVLPSRRVRSTRDSPPIDFRGAPLSAYRPSMADPLAIGLGPVIEVPVSSNPLSPGSPLGLGYLNGAGPKQTMRLVETYPAEDVVFLIHPWEAIDYTPRPGLPSWMERGCRADLSSLDSFLDGIRPRHRFVSLSELLHSPLERNERWWAAGVWTPSTPRPRIFLVTHVYEPIIGGVTTYLKTLAKALREEGFDVTVLAYPSLLVRHESARPRFRLRKLFHGAFVAASVLRILAARLRSRRVIVHSHGASFCLLVAYAAKLLGCVGLHTFHSPLYYRSAILRWFAPRLDALLHVSEQTQALYERTNGLHHDRVAIVPGGIDLTEVPSAVPDDVKRAARQRLGVDSGAFVAAFVGRIVKEKGIDIAIDAMARLRDSGIGAALVLAGPANARPEGQAYVSSLRAEIEAGQLHDRVRFLGAVERRDIEQLFAAADCLVVPSRWEEPAPMVVTEGLARGIPVIAASAGGLRARIVDGVTGLLFPPESAEALADRIARLAKDEAMRARLGRQARSWVERHGDVMKLARLHSKIYSVLAWEAGISVDPSRRFV